MWEVGEEKGLECRNLPALCSLLNLGIFTFQVREVPDASCRYGDLQTTAAQPSCGLLLLAHVLTESLFSARPCPWWQEHREQTKWTELRHSE